MFETKIQQSPLNLIFADYHWDERETQVALDFIAQKYTERLQNTFQNRGKIPVHYTCLYDNSGNDSDEYTRGYNDTTIKNSTQIVKHLFNDFACAVRIFNHFNIYGIK